MIKKECLELIKEFEGCKLKAYQLKGEDFYTIGYGIANKYPTTNQVIKKDDVITQERAEEELIRYCEIYIEQYIKDIEKYRKQPFTLNQEKALYSLLYNCGCYSFNKSKCKKYLCCNDDLNAMKQWDFGIYQVAEELKKGIKRRRNKEIELFFNVKNFFTI